MKMPTLEELMKAGVHFGHQKSKWHPKMGQYIFAERNGIHIVDLEQTEKLLGEALDFVKKTVSRGGTVLFVGTKKQAQNIVKDAALSCNMPYIISRWLGGTLTNATTVLGLPKKLHRLKEDNASGKLDKYTKKEKLDLTREMERLDNLVGGIEKMDRLPDAVFIVDLKHEKTAVKEAVRRGVPIIALCDTNVNPEVAEYPIPGNDDATKSIELIVKLVAEAAKEGKEQPASTEKRGEPASTAKQGEPAEVKK